jgi:cell filamentation protein
MGNTSWTPSPEDNLLGLTNNDLINEHEAKGLTMAELYVFELDNETAISTTIIKEIHKLGFGELYDWAGNWRNTQIIVGQLDPPQPNQILQLMYQFVDTLNYKIESSVTIEEHIKTLAFSHYEFIRIHPFNNGNGRTGRILMNWVALKFGYKPLELYHREGESRKIYINAMKEGDNGNFAVLEALIAKELTAF